MLDWAFIIVGFRSSHVRTGFRTSIPAIWKGIMIMRKGEMYISGCWIIVKRLG